MYLSHLHRNAGLLRTISIVNIYDSALVAVSTVKIQDSRAGEMHRNHANWTTTLSSIAIPLARKGIFGLERGNYSPSAAIVNSRTEQNTKEAIGIRDEAG